MTTATVDMNARAVERLQAAINAFGQPKLVSENDSMIEATTRNAILLNSIMEEFIHYVYTPHPHQDGYLCLTASGFIKRGVITPWSYSNKATTRREKKILRSRFNASWKKRDFPLFTFDKKSRFWQLHIDRYPTLESALAWWDSYCIPSLSTLASELQTVN